MWSSFEEKSREIVDLDKILGLLSWDDETLAPPKARPGRGKQLGTLEAIRHQRLTDPAFGELIEKLSGEKDPLKAAWIRRAKKRRDLAVRVPERLVKALAEVKSEALVAWQEARAKNTFETFAPALEKMFALMKERGQALAAGGDAYDALIDELEPGMTAAKLKPLFARLREALVPLVREVTASNADQPSLFEQDFDEKAQWDLTITALKTLGFELESRQAGQIGASVHRNCG